MTPSLAVFGNFTIDDLVFPDGSTRWAVPGGSAIYAAFGASLWVEDVSVGRSARSRLSHDITGRAL